MDRTSWMAAALALSACGTGPAASNTMIGGVTMADTGAVAKDIGVTIPATAIVEHAERIAGRDNAARLVVLLPAAEWQMWRGQLVQGEVPPASPDANFHLGPDEGGWAPGKATGLSTVQLPWRGGTESLNLGYAQTDGGKVRAFLFWHQR